MEQEKCSLCQYCMDGKCYANSAVSPEEYDSHPPKCNGCKAVATKRA